MKTPPKVISWFEEIGRADIPVAGGKGANLGELTRAQVPVPRGFIVTADAYFRLLKEARLIDRMHRSLRYLHPRDTTMPQEVAFAIRQMISLAPMPSYMAEEIQQAYYKMQQ